jgi:hypothetical protein
MTNMYRALRNITGENLIAKDTENLTVDQLGGEESIERLIRIGAIEEMPTGKKAKAAETKDEAPKDADKAPAEKTGSKAAERKEK